MHTDARRLAGIVLAGLVLAASSGCGDKDAPPTTSPAPLAPLTSFPAGWPSDADRTMKPDHAPPTSDSGANEKPMRSTVPSEAT